ncbi:hypothetical protein EDD18DRAFT_1114731 [Armillaria luteobubalina]|uniref:Uncharacterized protein n=1 Tax=Armillaria luteobubalina TaxID=153913 RepID=A0AA39UFX6_9AGAR|nr:hypothetical protein EDD18DRAFT_1114731 [Armillaria luteobubalina]
MSPLGQSPKMNMDRVHGVRQVRIKMKLHRVGIHGLVEEIEIRLEGQVRNMKYGIETGKRICWIPIRMLHDKHPLNSNHHHLKSEKPFLTVHYVFDFVPMFQTPEVYVAPPMLEDTDPDALEELYAEWDEKNAMYHVAVEAHNE